YNEPAKAWVEALPLGNSRLRAMVYGIPQREELQLNAETTRGGGPQRNDNPNALQALPEAQKLVFEGKTREADRLVNQNFFTKIHGMPFQTAGSVLLKFAGHEKNSDYYRELDIDRAVALTRYTVDGVTYTRETFSSFVDNVIIMRITASKKGAVNFELSYTKPKPATYQVFAKNNALVFEGKGASHEGIEAKVAYQTHAAVKTSDGKVSFNDSTMSVSGATVATLYISIGTNFIDYKTVGADYEKKAAAYLAAAMTKDYNTAIKNHSA